MEQIEYILKEFDKCDISLSKEQGEKLLKLYDFLVEYNEKVNLTAITDFEEVVIKHFVDSILPFSKLTHTSSSTLFSPNILDTCSITIISSLSSIPIPFSFMACYY